jgi:hypothetical protein
MTHKASLNHIERQMKALRQARAMNRPKEELNVADNAQINRILEAFSRDEDAPADCDPALVALANRMIDEFFLCLS